MKNSFLLYSAAATACTEDYMENQKEIQERYEMRVKKPTLTQKKLMKASGLDWNTWNVLEEDNNSITLISKKSGRKRVLLK